MGSPLSALSQTGTNTVVAAVAAEESLPLLTPDQIPSFGTFWLVLENSRGTITIVPLPWLLPDAAGFNIYGITSDEFLVDESTNDVSTMSTNAIAVQATQLLNVIDLVQNAETAHPARMDFDIPFPGGSGTNGDSGYYLTNDINYTWDTNQLWLQITNVSSGTAFANLYNATDQVYAIWSTPDLITWQVETELWPANTNCQPFTVPTLNRQDLYLRAEDWTGVTENGNTTPDWWFWMYFGTTALSDTNLNAIGNTLLSDYQSGIDPNLIQFSVQFTSDYVSTNVVSGLISLASGTPGSMAILVNDTNQLDATWIPFSANIVANLSSGDGAHQVMVGVRGSESNSIPVWLQTTLYLDTSPLIITITNPISGTVSKPVIQVQGFANRSLAGLNYDFSNSLALLTNEPAFVTGETHDTNLLTGTAYFQCYDISLTNGLNEITLHATDIFGHVATTNVSIVLDYTGATNPPTMTLTWPTNGTIVAGNSFTCQGMLDDATASIMVVSGTNSFPGLVERSGRFFAANVPLSDITNVFTVTATNAAGYGTSQTLTVLQGFVSLTVDPVPADQLSQEFITVTGTIGDTNHDIWVNGVQATVSGDPTWEADNVPLPDNDGSGQLSLNTYSAGSDPSTTAPDGSQQLIVFQQPKVQAVDFMEQFVANTAGKPLVGGANPYYNIAYNRQWTNTLGGTNVQICDAFIANQSKIFNYIWPDYWPDGQLVNGTCTQNGSTFDVETIATPTSWALADWNNSGTIPDNDFGDVVFKRQIYRKAVTDLQLVSAGPALPNVFQLVRLVVSAAGYSDNGLGEDEYSDYYYLSGETGFEGPGDIPLAATNIQFLGQTLAATATNANVGERYVLLPAGAKMNLPTKITTPTNNYSVNVQSVPGVTIVDTNSGVDLTLQTNTVIVGQLMSMTLQTVTTNGPTLTNFQWTVPGITFSDYVATAQSAVLYTNFATNQATVNFVWADGATNRIVQCSATVNRQLITASAVFNVLRPEITWQLAPKYPVSITNRCDVSGLWLTCGQGRECDDTNLVGIYANYQVQDLKGYTNSFQLYWVQLLSLVTKVNVNGNTNLSFFRYSSGLDNGNPEQSFYVRTWLIDPGLFPIGEGANWNDSPGIELSGFGAFYSTINSFHTYLLFQPSGGKMVPLKEADWSWGGNATLVDDTVSPPIYQKASPASNPSASIGSDYLNHPVWTNNVFPITVITNNFWYPVP